MNFAPLLLLLLQPPSFFFFFFFFPLLRILLLLLLLHLCESFRVAAYCIKRISRYAIEQFSPFFFGLVEFSFIFHTSAPYLSFERFFFCAYRQMFWKVSPRFWDAKRQWRYSNQVAWVILIGAAIPSRYNLNFLRIPKDNGRFWNDLILPLPARRRRLDFGALL